MKKRVEIIHGTDTKAFEYAINQFMENHHVYEIQYQPIAFEKNVSGQKYTYINNRALIIYLAEGDE